MVEGVDLLVPSATAPCGQEELFRSLILSALVDDSKRVAASRMQPHVSRQTFSTTGRWRCSEPRTSVKSGRRTASGQSRGSLSSATPFRNSGEEGEYTLVAEADPTNSAGAMVTSASNTRRVPCRRRLGESLISSCCRSAVHVRPMNAVDQLGVKIEARVHRLEMRALTRVDHSTSDLILSRDNAGSNDDTQLGRFRVENLAGAAELRNSFNLWSYLKISTKQSTDGLWGHR